MKMFILLNFQKIKVKDLIIILKELLVLLIIKKNPYLEKYLNQNLEVLMELV